MCSIFAFSSLSSFSLNPIHPTIDQTPQQGRKFRHRRRIGIGISLVKNPTEKILGKMMSDDNQTVHVIGYDMNVNFLERYALLLANTLKTSPSIGCNAESSQLLARAALETSPDLNNELNEEMLGSLFRTILDNREKTNLDAAIRLINAPQLFGSRIGTAVGQKRTLGMVNEEDIALVDGHHPPTTGDDVRKVTPSTKHSRLPPPTSSSSDTGTGAGASGSSSASALAASDGGRDDTEREQQQGKGNGSGQGKGEEKQSRKRGRPTYGRLAQSARDFVEKTQEEGHQDEEANGGDEANDDENDVSDRVPQTTGKDKDAAMPSRHPRGTLVLCYLYP